MADWLHRQWNDIKGNAKWALLGLLWAVALWAANHLLSLIPHMPQWLAYAVVLVFSATGFFYFARHRSKTVQAQSARFTTVQSVASAALAPVASPIDVNAFFAHAYSGQLQDEIEQNVRAMICSRPDHERENFTVRFIATGLIAVIYERVWLTIYRSQVLALEALNQRVLRREQVKEFYDVAALESPNVCAGYSFDQWLSYLKSEILVLDIPGDSLGITIRGKDFLKYMVHCGYTANDKKN